jgi:hypothetical protein
MILLIGLAPKNAAVVVLVARCRGHDIDGLISGVSDREIERKFLFLDQCGSTRTNVVRKN